MDKVRIQVKIESTIDKIWSMWSEANHIKNGILPQTTGMFPLLNKTL